jgi:hypothetical protein
MPEPIPGYRKISPLEDELVWAGLHRLGCRLSVLDVSAVAIHNEWLRLSTKPITDGQKIDALVGYCAGEGVGAPARRVVERERLRVGRDPAAVRARARAATERRERLTSTTRGAEAWNA